jgi:hypothetical protein
MSFRFLFIHIGDIYVQNLGVRGDAVGRGTALQDGRSRFRFPMGSFGYFVDLILPAALWPLDRLSL